MQHPSFHYRQGVLQVEQVDLRSVADRFGTPTYIYSAGRIQDNYRRLASAFAPLRPHISYAAKACGNLHILRLLTSLGAGVDVVSGGELERAFLSGAQASRITFAGTGKTVPEIRAALDGRASLLRGSGLVDDLLLERRGSIAMFNVESEGELDRIAMVARECGVRARCCLRVNPNVDAKTHKYTTTGKRENKFGVDIAEAPRIFRAWQGNESLSLLGLHFHLGSPIASPAPYVEALQVILSVIDQIERGGAKISVLNIGGGFGIDYGNAPQGVASLEEFAAAIVPILLARSEAGLQVHMEPGRVIVGDAGVLLTRVEYVKRAQTKRFVICDAGMHTLVRPALYGAYHFAWPVSPGEAYTPVGKSPAQPHPGLQAVDIVGPICESSDFLAQDRHLPPIEPGDLIAVFDAGAYGMSMASTYNDQPRPAEVLVSGSLACLVAPRQSIADLLGGSLDLETQGEPKA